VKAKTEINNKKDGYTAITPHTIVSNNRVVTDNNRDVDSNVDVGLKVVDGKTYKVFFTSYNPEKRQTDGSPCTGASGHDQCKLAKEGMRIIALDQGLVGRTGKKAFKYDDHVWLKGETDDPRCNGEFVVLDTMNARYTGKRRGDLFMMNRADNTSCTATIHKM